jgi:septum formation protein
MIPENLNRYKIILASKSPRRHFLLKEIGIPFESFHDAMEDETYPPGLKGKEVALYLAEKKMNRLTHLLRGNHLVITADTIVWLEDHVVEKPADLEEARNMLATLSGKVHRVYTGVCLASVDHRKIFCSETDVHFRELLPEEIDHYVNHFRPLDKAGAYGVQEWIGYVGVKRIEGSYFNVMGLPIQMLYECLKTF